MTRQGEASSVIEGARPCRSPGLISAVSHPVSKRSRQWPRIGMSTVWWSCAWISSRRRGAGQDFYLEAGAICQDTVGLDHPGRLPVGLLPHVRVAGHMVGHHIERRGRGELCMLLVHKSGVGGTTSGMVWPLLLSQSFAILPTAGT